MAGTLKTRKAYVEYLNEIGSTYENCVYMTVPSRGRHLTPNALRRRLANNEYGNLLRSYDSIAFEVGFNDWKL
jgi:hypothetical protein